MSVGAGRAAAVGIRVALNASAAAGGGGLSLANPFAVLSTHSDAVDQTM